MAGIQASGCPAARVEWGGLGGTWHRAPCWLLCFAASPCSEPPVWEESHSSLHPTRPGSRVAGQTAPWPHAAGLDPCSDTDFQQLVQTLRSG